MPVRSRRDEFDDGRQSRTPGATRSMSPLRAGEPAPQYHPAGPLPRRPPMPLDSSLAPTDAETTIELLDRAKTGDDDARNRLVERCLPPLRRWARGRLPACARDVNDTVDVVQDTIIAALRRLHAFEVRHEGALQAYLRQALANRITDLIRHRRRRPDGTDVPDDLEAPDASPLDQAVGSENLRRYERALEQLRPEDREAIVARLELQYDYDELAAVLAKPSASAARMAVMRAMKRLAQAMRGDDGEG